MARLSVAFNHTLSPATMTLYWERLSGHSDEGFTAAVTALIDHEEKFPPIGKIKDAIRNAGEAGRSSPTTAKHATTIMCSTCKDAGWVINLAVPVGQRDRLIPCPECGGATNRGHANPAAAKKPFPVRTETPESIRNTPMRPVRSPFPVGSRDHEAFGNRFRNLIKVWSNKIDLLQEEYEINPDPDIERRIANYVELIAQMEKNLATYDRTGEFMAAVPEVT